MFHRFSRLPSGSPASWPLLAHGRLTTAFLCILVALGGAGILHAAAQHPNLFVNAKELDQLRTKLKTESWRARLLEQVRQDADAGNPVAAAVVYALTEDRVCGAKVRAHLVKQAKDFVPGRPGAQYPWGPEAGSAVAFDLVAPLLSASEQQAVAGFLRQLAQDAIKYHTRQPLTPNMSFVCHWRIGLIGYAIADPQIIEWAVNDPGPPWGGKRPGRWGGFKQRIEHALTDGAFWDEATIYGNFSILGMMYLAESARHCDGTDLYNYTSPNGGSLCKAIAGLVSLAYPIERTGVGRGSVRMATWGDGSTAPPNRVNNESGDAFFVNKPNIFPERQNLYPIIEIAYHAWKEPQYAYLLALNPRRDGRLGWFEYLPVSLLLGESLPPETPPAAMPSIVYPQTGIALLRSDESPGYWTSAGLVAVQQLGRNYGHDHRDKFELMLWGRGRLLYPDWNAQQYEPMEYGWTRNAWAHSTLVVDESNPTGGRSAERHDFSAHPLRLPRQAQRGVPRLDPVLLLARDRALADGQGPAARRPSTHAGRLPLDLPSEPRSFAGVRAALDPEATGPMEPSPRQHQCLLAAPRRRAVPAGFRSGGQTPLAGGRGGSRPLKSSGAELVYGTWWTSAPAAGTSHPPS